jgi:hypothetical protein
MSETVPAVAAQRYSTASPVGGGPLLDALLVDDELLVLDVLLVDDVVLVDEAPLVDDVLPAEDVLLVDDVLDAPPVLPVELLVVGPPELDEAPEPPPPPPGRTGSRPTAHAGTIARARSAAPALFQLPWVR